jgi:uncharacterized protein (DUF488 family)
MSTLYTIGHSNHPIDKFLELLYAHDIKQLIDIRAMPKSRWVPWFNKEKLSKLLEESGVEYHHLLALAGRRTALKNSKNTGWENEAFRGYADYMQTKDFLAGLTELNKLIKNNKTVIMCAEAVPWQCHRSLVADAEIIRGHKVLHILNTGDAKEHSLTHFAVVDKDADPIKIYYPHRNLEL